MDLNPSAARSLEEGLEETLTVHRLHMPPQLRKTLASTNVIESAFSIVERVCCNVKRWHGGDQRERWVGSGLLVAEKQFRRIQGYKQIPVLLSSRAESLSRFGGKFRSDAVDLRRPGAVVSSGSQECTRKITVLANTSTNGRKAKYKCRSRVI